MNKVVMFHYKKIVFTPHFWILHNTLLITFLQVAYTKFTSGGQVLLTTEHVLCLQSSFTLHEEIWQGKIVIKTVCTCVFFVCFSSSKSYLIFQKSPFSRFVDFKFKSKNSGGEKMVGEPQTPTANWRWRYFNFPGLRGLHSFLSFV